jgi:hypothetical protein
MKQFESRESYILKFPAHHPAVKKLTKKEYIKEQKRIAARTLEEIEADRRLAFEKVTQARKEYLLRFPFMGFIICKMQMVWLDKVRTMGVSIRECNIYCYYCAPWVNTLTVEETMGVLEHEALHVLDLHMSRMASREPTAWNIACDMAINWLIKLKLPKEGTFAPKKLDNSKDKVAVVRKKRKRKRKDHKDKKELVELLAEMKRGKVQVEMVKMKVAVVVRVKDMVRWTITMSGRTQTTQDLQKL